MSKRKPYIARRADWARDAGWNGGWDGAAAGTNVSFIFSEQTEAGLGPKLHSHDYDEVQIVRRGRAHFRVGDQEISAEEGDILVIPAGTPHLVRSVGELSDVISVHLTDVKRATWLE